MQQECSFDYDVFISYSHCDKEWVHRQLLPRLKRARIGHRRLRVCIDCESFRPGAPVVTETERAVPTSRKMVLVLTPAYLESEWTQFENILLQTLDPINRQLRLIPLLLEPCTLPPHLSAFLCVDFTGPGPHDTEFRQLIATIKGKLPQENPCQSETEPKRPRQGLDAASGLEENRCRSESEPKLRRSNLWFCIVSAVFLTLFLGLMLRVPGWFRNLNFQMQAAVWTACFVGLGLGALWLCLQGKGDRCITSFLCTVGLTLGVLMLVPTNVGQPFEQRLPRATITSTPPIGWWQVDYYNGNDFNVYVSTNYEPGPFIVCDWSTSSPGHGVDSDRFSVRYQRTEHFREPGSWQFTVRAHGGFRLYIDDRLVPSEWWDGWHDVSPTEYIAAGDHKIKLEYFGSAFSGKVELFWRPVHATPTPNITKIPESMDNKIITPTPMFTLEPRSEPTLSSTSQIIAQPPAEIPVPEMVLVMGGEFLMGRADNEPSFYSDPNDLQRCEDEKPKHLVFVDSFCIGRYEVTNAEYAAFVENTDYPAPPDWEGGKMPVGKERHPVVNVSWYDASEYCRWLSEVSGLQFRLPTEEEWEKAASWDPSNGRKRFWPWGNDWKQANCNCLKQGTMPVGSYPGGASAYGVLDMAGNVWEWTADWYDAYPGATHWNPKFGTTYRVVRGGSYNCEMHDARCTYRGRYKPDTRIAIIGFRVACSAPCTWNQ